MDKSIACLDFCNFFHLGYFSSGKIWLLCVENDKLLHEVVRVSRSVRSQKLSLELFDKASQSVVVFCGEKTAAPCFWEKS